MIKAGRMYLFICLNHKILKGCFTENKTLKLVLRGIPIFGLY